MNVKIKWSISSFKNKSTKVWYNTKVNVNYISHRLGIYKIWDLIFFNTCCILTFLHAGESFFKPCTWLRVRLNWKAQYLRFKDSVYKINCFLSFDDRFSWFEKLKHRLHDSRIYIFFKILLYVIRYMLFGGNITILQVLKALCYTWTGAILLIFVLRKL